MARINDPEIQKIDNYLSMHLDVDLSYFNDMLEKFPDNLYLLSRKAIYYLDEIKNNEAYDILNSINPKDNDYKVYYLVAKGIENRRSFIFDKNGNKYFEEALKLECDNVYVLYRLYWSYLSIHFLPENIRQKHVSLNELNLEYANNPHLIIDKILSIDKNYFPALLVKVNMFQKGGDYQKTINLLEEVKPEVLNSELKAYLGEAHFQLGHMPIAYQLINESIDENPIYESYLILGYQYSEQGDDNQAIALFEKAFNFDKSRIEAIGELASYYMAIEKYDLAVKYLKMLVDEHYENDECFKIIMISVYLNIMDTAQEYLDKYTSTNDIRYQISENVIDGINNMKNIDKEDLNLIIGNEYFSKEKKLLEGVLSQISAHNRIVFFNQNPDLTEEEL